MQIDQAQPCISDAEKNGNQMVGLCLYCAESGYIKSGCPAKVGLASELGYAKSQSQQRGMSWAGIFPVPPVHNINICLLVLWQWLTRT